MSGRSFFDLRSPAMRPLWVRLLVTGLTLGWAVFELVNGSAGWAILFGAAGAYLVWALFVTWDPDAIPDPSAGKPTDPPADPPVDPENR